MAKDSVGFKLLSNLQKTNREFAELDKELAKSSKEVSNFGKSLKTAFESSAIISFISSLKDVTNMMLKASEKQANYIEDLNLLNKAFGDTSESAKELIAYISGETGWDVSTLTKTLANFRQLTTSVGKFSSETADILADNLLQFSMDISSLYNLSLDEAVSKLNSAIAGQTRAIYSLGGDITIATMQEKALSLGITDNVRTMNRAEKEILIYLTLVDQLNDSEGDLASTINSITNQSKIFTEQVKQLGRQLGGFILPLLKTILPILNGILMVVNELISMLMTFLGLDATAWADEFGTGLSNGLDNIIEGLNGVEGASNKAKKSLRGFDKLNNITTSSASGSGSGTGTGGGINKKLLDELKKYNLHLDDIKNKAVEIKEQIMEWLGFSKDVNGQWKWSADKLLKNIYNWFKKLNYVGKLFVALGIAVAVVELYNAFKKLATLLMNTNIGTWIYTIVGSLGEKGLSGTISALLKTQPTLTKFISTIAGITAVVDGVMKLADAFHLIATGEAEIGDYLDVLWGLLEVAGGIAIVIGGLTGNVTAIVGGVVGLGVALGGSFLTNLITSKEETNNAKTATDDYRKALEDLDEEIKNNYTQTEAKARRAEELVGQLKNLVDENGRVKGSEEEVSTKLDALNDLLGTNYDLTDGVITLDGRRIKSLNELTSSVEKYCGSLRAQAMLELFREKYTTVLGQQLELQDKIKNKQEELKKTQEGYDLTTKEGMEKWFRDHAEQIADLNELQQLYEENSKYLENYEKAGYEASIGNYEEAQKLLTTTVEDVEYSLGNTVESIISKSDEMAKSIKDNIASIDGLTASIKLQLNTNEFNKEFEKTRKMTFNGINLNWQGGGAYADGGFVNSGEVFLARENGLPEMVGSFGNRTAVANNDQIVDGITAGVVKGMKAVGGGTSNVTIEAKGDAEGLMNFITFKQKQQNRQYGL